ncbi:hypothetical protein N7448_003494 [Penicillium atrosanguineum]|nr:hypothetical protein N7526_009297 [Penicillium atrosanguineum]KAJ5140086.1 hypothetical protein N7448_003494 [Penicillium atrosanguineum]
MATPTETQIQRERDYERFKNYTAYGFLIVAPIIIALPPRRLDLNSVALASAFAFSANYITHERTGRSIVERIESRISTRPGIMRELPSGRAEEVQAKLRAARDAQMQNAAGEELEKMKARQDQEQGVVDRVWMGGESVGWKERRLREEQKAIEEGKGYGDLIMDHIWDVWNWGRKTEEEEDDDE